MNPDSGSMQTKKFVLPDNAQILKVNSSLDSVEMDENEIVVKNTSDDFNRFDISISFADEYGFGETRQGDASAHRRGQQCRHSGLEGDLFGASDTAGRFYGLERSPDG
jgi:hypothetical protein